MRRVEDGPPVPQRAALASPYHRNSGRRITWISGSYPLKPSEVETSVYLNDLNDGQSDFLAQTAYLPKDVTEDADSNMKLNV